MDALRDFGYLDWQFSALVCKTLWNYSDKMTSSLSCFGAEETELLIEQLEVYLGEEMHMWQAHLETASYAGSQNSRRKSLKITVRFPFVTRKQSYVSY